MKLALYFAFFYLFLYLYGVSLLFISPGTLTRLMRILLPIVCTGMLMASPFVLGWWAMIGMCALTILILPSLRKLAKVHVGKILGHDVGFGDVGPWEEFGVRWKAGKVSPGQLFSESDKAWAQREQMLVEIEKRREVQAVLRQNEISSKEFRELYKTLMANALEDLAWDILGHPDKLQRLIDLGKNNSGSREFSAAFRGWGRRGITVICVSCEKIRDTNNLWEDAEHYLSRHSNIQFARKLCPKCRERFPESVVDPVGIEKPASKNMKTETICLCCQRILDNQGIWQKIDEYFKDVPAEGFTHGLCETCMERLYQTEQNLRKVAPKQP